MNKFDTNLVRWSKVYPNIQDCSIQIFSDKKDQDDTCSRILPMTRSNLELCMDMQKQKPCWIFFSVNPMKEGQRNKDSVTKIQTRIVDIDEWTKDRQLELIWDAPLLPSLVVESVHGFHLYYLAETELTKEQFEEWNQWLRDYYGWDQKVVKDTARVLRLPWFLHQKWNPVLVLYREELSCQDKYTVEQILKAFPKKKIEKPEVEIKPIEKKRDCNDSYRYKVNQLDTKQMLWELSWTRWVNWEIIDFKRNGDWTEQIRVNGKSTSCWLDRNWMIGSYDKWWPTYLQRMEYYLNRKFTKSERIEFAKRLNSNHPELEEKKEKKVEEIDIKKLRENPPKKIWLEKPDFTRGEKWLDDAIGKLSKGQLVVLSWETWAGKTTFATFMARKNPNSCYFVLEDTMANIAKRYAIRWAWITRAELNEWSRWEEKEQKFNTAYDRFLNQDINFIDVGKKIEIEALLKAMEDLIKEWYGMFFIDNLGFVIGNWQTEADQTADISSRLVSFCLEKNVCVVLLHHFKKWNSNSPRDIGQLRGSGKLGDDSFLVANYMRQWDETVLRLLKDRNRWELKDYIMIFDRGDFIFKNEERR